MIVRTNIVRTSTRYQYENAQTPFIPHLGMFFALSHAVNMLWFRFAMSAPVYDGA